MARYYDITVFQPGSGAASPAANVLTSIAYEWTSFPNGKNDPNALNVELDILTSIYGIPGGDLGSSTVTIEGIPLSLLQQANNFGIGPNDEPGAQITIKGGMQAGLPLANSKQAGLLLQGQVFQSYGNWVGTEMNISFVIVQSNFTLDRPGNFVFNWLPGISLAQALQTMLTNAYRVYPSYTISMQLTGTYSTSFQVYDIERTLTQMTQFINRYEPDITITIQGTEIIVSDTVNIAQLVKLQFTDFIGQPKLVGPGVVQFMTVMRADIQPNTLVQMPIGAQNIPGIVQTSPQQLPAQLQNKTSFQGQFIIQSVRHVGNFRDANGASWASIFQAKQYNAG